MIARPHKRQKTQTVQTRLTVPANVHMQRNYDNHQLIGRRVIEWESHTVCVLIYSIPSKGVREITDWLRIYATAVRMLQKLWSEASEVVVECCRWSSLIVNWAKVWTFLLAGGDQRQTPIQSKWLAAATETIKSNYYTVHCKCVPIKSFTYPPAIHHPVD